jgi:acetolactate synthase-1/2/3 large subunit
MGVAGIRVDTEAALGAALEAALAATGPFVVDVWIDRDEPPVRNSRNQSLVEQGVNSASVS